MEQEVDDEVELDDDEVEEAEADLALADDDEEDNEESSLEALLAQRSARRGGKDDSDDDDDIMSFTAGTEREPGGGEVAGRVIPIKDRQEFVCARCHLVKARSQLADAERGLCRDCV